MRQPAVRYSVLAVLTISASLASLSAPANAGGRFSVPNPREFPGIRDECAGTDADYDVERAFDGLAARMKATPRHKRREVLRTAAMHTKWGSPERLAAYYLCAWYGINYRQSRDYLVRAAYWYEWGYAKSGGLPVTWPESVGPLYALCEHNRDTAIADVLLTTTRDAAAGYSSEDIELKLYKHHPRIVLSAARLSWICRSNAIEMISGRHFINTGDYSIGTQFARYCRRVSSNYRDPLRLIASSLLTDAQRLQDSLSRHGRQRGRHWDRWIRARFGFDTPDVICDYSSSDPSALSRHPRSIIRAAGSSILGRWVALDTLVSEAESRSSGDTSAWGRARTRFCTYVHRVAVTRGDPLRPTARSLLKEAVYIPH